MLVKLAPPTMADLLAVSAWFPLLNSGAQARVRDELREVDVPQGGALCRTGDTPVHWYGAIEGLLKWTVTSGDGRSVTLGGLVPDAEVVPDLFAPIQDRRALCAVVDRLNQRFGQDTVRYGLLPPHHVPYTGAKIAFGRIPTHFSGAVA